MSRLRSIGALTAVGVAFLLSAVACGDGAEEANTPTATVAGNESPAATVEDPTAENPGESPVSGPPPGQTESPVPGEGGEFIDPREVTWWVYEEPPAGTTRCIDVWDLIVPASDAESATTTFTCTIERAHLEMTSPAESPDPDAYYLGAVRVLAYVGQSLPDGDGEHWCTDVSEYLLDANESTDASQGRFTCLLEPAPRGASTEDSLRVWAIVRDGAADEVPADTTCDDLMPYRSQGQEGFGSPVICLIPQGSEAGSGSTG